MACANVVASGYFPWRDMFLVHGLFPDVLAGSVGQAIFGDSIWGVHAGHIVILIPLFWVCIYLFAVWVSRRNPWFLALVFLGVIGLGTAAAGGAVHGRACAGAAAEVGARMSFPRVLLPAERFVAWPVA